MGKTKQKQPNTRRQLKIYNHFRSSDNKQVPELRLAGLWIEELGFNIGDIVSITTREKLIIVQPENETITRQRNYKKTLQAIQRNLNEAE
jgi:toxic protein SymE